MGSQRPVVDTEMVATGWTHPLLAWHLAFWFLLGMLAMATYIVSDGAGNWFGLVPVLVGFGASYHFIGRKAVDSADDRPRWLYVGLLSLWCGLATYFVSAAAFLLFIAIPHAWHLGRTLLRGLLGTVAVLTAVALGGLAADGFTVGNLLGMLPWLVISLAVAIGLGVSIDRLVRQSEQRGHLIAELHRTRGQLAEAHHAAGVAVERERVAREIHDTLAQGFTSIVMLAQNARSDGDGVDPRILALIEETARDNLADARALVAATAPVALDGSTLTDALRRLGERFGRETGITVDVRLEQLEEDAAAIPASQQVVLLRTAQEALANVRKHAAAERVVVTLGQRDGAPAIDIDDDGVGFDPVAPRVRGFGLEAMRGRVEESGGTLRLHSRPGEGTRVRVQLPAPARRSEAAS